MTEEKKEYLKIGEYIPADEEKGTPEVISRDYYRQGWIFKDEEAYLDEEELWMCKCGKWYWCYGVDQCPYCGADKKEENYAG